MPVARTARCAALLLAAALLAGCTATASTPPARIALAGRGVEITATPVPAAAFTACSDRIAADKAVKAAALAKAKADRAARAARTAAKAARAAAPTRTVRGGSATRPLRILYCNSCRRTSIYTGAYPTRCPRCGQSPFPALLH